VTESPAKNGVARKPIRDLAKRAVRTILKRKAFRSILRVPIVERRLRSSTVYPGWVWKLRDVLAMWSSQTPDWEAILKKDMARWQAARGVAQTGPKILMATTTSGFSPSSMVESMLAVALTLRGADVHILACDAHLPACFVPSIQHFPDTGVFAKDGPSSHMCSECVRLGKKAFYPLGFRIHRHSELISRDELARARQLSSDLPANEIADYRLDGVAVGEDAVSSAVHFYARGDLVGEPHGTAILRRYFLASLQATYEFRRLLGTYSFSCICMHHGVYVPHGAFTEVARQHNVRVATWAPEYRNQTFIFSHQDSYHRTMLSEPTSQWESMPWCPEKEAQILDYLNSRRQGSRDWISYMKNTQEDLSAIVAELGLDSSKPWIGLLTNVVWDAQVHHSESAFPGMIPWLLQTIQYFVDRPDLQLIIRAHPAELQNPIRSRQPVVDIVNQAFHKLPGNIRVIPPDKPINTYALMSLCDTAIIYATKTGVELACLGIPVIVAGDAWVRNKGVTSDAKSPEEYFRLLDRLPLRQRLDEAVTQRARKYAYHYFFRRMIPLPMFVPGSPYTLSLSGLDDLLPGRSIGLDVVCNGILNGDEFVYLGE
jgi:hypothetical protein